MFAGAGPPSSPNADPSYGMINPAGQNCMRLMGVPREPGGAVTSGQEQPGGHGRRLRHARSILTGGRRQLISARWLHIRLHRVGPAPGQPAVWKAVRAPSRHQVDDANDFAEVEMPGLWETGWTVWSVTPFGQAGDPKGGYLVGATLYFDPWKESDWEWTPAIARPSASSGTSLGAGQARLGRSRPDPGRERAQAPHRLRR
jgi:hypothetical protein